ncbi:MAG: rhamnulokinase, partial [Muribaculaceae bacterium]|nr:rhamnulokinase [Muribaculaceae bacterium]
TKTYHLAVDLGATSGRTILASFDGKKVDMQEIARYHYPMLPIGSHQYWNLPLIYQHIIESMKKCADILAGMPGQPCLESLGIDTWGCDVAYFLKDGSIASLPYCYRDSHTVGAVDRFCKEIPKEEVYARTGIQFMDFNTLFQLDTIRRNNPEVLDNADKILFMPDALSYMLTGKAVTERTVASTSQILNPNTGDLDEVLLAKIGLSRDKFGPMIEPGEEIGTLIPRLAEITGLGEVPVVAVAGHDTASAVAAVPTPDKDYAYLSCGTWSLLGIENEGPIITEKSLEYNFTNEGGVDGTIRVLKNITGLWLFERCREEFKDAPSDISELAALYLESDCPSIVNPDDPSFANPTSMTKAIDEYCEKTNQPKPEKPADYIRVVYQSLAHRYGEITEWLRELSPVEIKRLHVIGGGSRNKHLMQMAADSLGIPVVAGPAECTALGNVLMQLRACKSLSSLKEMREVAINSTETITYTPQL